MPEIYREPTSSNVRSSKLLDGVTGVEDSFDLLALKTSPLLETPLIDGPGDVGVDGEADGEKIGVVGNGEV